MQVKKLWLTQVEMALILLGFGFKLYNYSCDSHFFPGTRKFNSGPCTCQASAVPLSYIPDPLGIIFKYDKKKQNMIKETFSQLLKLVGFLL